MNHQQDYHFQVVLGSEEDMEMIMQMIGWWLKSTAQGMWCTGLQYSEETASAGWILFSADEYNREVLMYRNLGPGTSSE